MTTEQNQQPVPAQNPQQPQQPANTSRNIPGFNIPQPEITHHNPAPLYPQELSAPSSMANNPFNQTQIMLSIGGDVTGGQAAMVYLNPKNSSTIDRDPGEIMVDNKIYCYDKTMNNAIIILSGGLDSSVVAYQVKSQAPERIKSVFFNYGQRALIQEEFAAGEISKRIKAEFIRIDIPWLGRISPSLINRQEQDVHKTTERH